MLLKEEFAANMSYLEPSINAMIVAGEGIFFALKNYFSIFLVNHRLYLNNYNYNYYSITKSNYN